MPSKRSSQRCWCRRASATTSCRDDGPRSARAENVDPGVVRSGRSVRNETATSPRRPCARPMRPTSRTRGSVPPLIGGAARSLRDVDAGLHAFERAGGARHLSDRLDDPAATPDETTHVGRARVHEEEDLVAAALLEVDVDHVGLLGQRAGAVLDDGLRAGADDAVALGADLVLEVVLVDVDALVVVGRFLAQASSSVGSSAASSAAGASAAVSSTASSALGASAFGASSAGGSASASAAGASAAGCSFFLAFFSVCLPVA